MSRCLQHFSCAVDKKTVVIVATSGDTGGAVASGFFGLEGVKVVILYPKGRVSRVQELQLTTLGGNVITLKYTVALTTAKDWQKQRLRTPIFSQ